MWEEEHTPLLSQADHKAAGSVAVSFSDTHAHRPTTLKRHLSAVVEAPTFRGDVPDTDVDENAAKRNDEAVREPTPPDGYFEPIDAYPLIGTTEVLQPASDNASRRSARPRQKHQSLPPVAALSEPEARSALVCEVGEHCCWGSRAARDMLIANISASHAFHYKLETFTERRLARWSYAPFSQDAQSDANARSRGRALPAWEVSVPTPPFFRAGQQELEVPYTSLVKPCFFCGKHGKIRCHRCCGRGKLRCSSCKGQGYRTVGKTNEIVQRETCQHCAGTGRKRCDICFNHGQILCSVCQGHGQLRTFVQLIVQWQTHLDDYIIDNRDAPGATLASGRGTLLFEEEDELVSSIAQFEDADLVMGAERLQTQHVSRWPSDRILQQRHCVLAIPVYHVNYIWKDRPGRYIVYGLDLKVHAPNYPQRLLWGCTVL